MDFAVQVTKRFSTTLMFHVKHVYCKARKSIQLCKEESVFLSALSSAPRPAMLPATTSQMLAGALLERVEFRP